MSPDLIEDIRLEMKLLHELAREAGPLVESPAPADADRTRKLAAASVLQSFYNGVEKIFDRLAAEVDGERPAGEGRHERLLSQMAAERPARPAVISPELHAALREYFAFRHAYRYGHYFRLDWAAMESLASQMAATLERLEAELERFCRTRAGLRLTGREEGGELPGWWFAPPRRPAPAWQRSIALPLLGAAIAGAIVGAVFWSLLGRSRQSVSRQPAVAGEAVRRAVAPLVRQLRAAGGEEAARFAGVLEFLNAADWHFAAAGGGDVAGRSQSLGAEAALSFRAGRLVKIDLRAGDEWYLFSLGDGRVVRAAWLDRASALPKGAIDLGAAPRRAPDSAAAPR